MMDRYSSDFDFNVSRQAVLICRLKDIMLLRE
jgi:hypothetical protein